MASNVYKKKQHYTTVI